MDMSEAKNKKLASARPLHFWSTLAFLYVVCIIEGADQQLLPASFRALERTLGLTPTDLAKLGFAQGFVQCIAGLVWASLADAGWPRRSLLIMGTFSWGVLTLLLATVRNFGSMVVLRALNGVALGCIMPISQSIIADMTNADERGVFFGGVQFFMMAGFLFTSIFATAISNMTIWGWAGWRVAFMVVAGASCVLAAIMSVFMREPPRTNFKEERLLPADTVMLKLSKYWQIPTFRLLVLQGAFGCIPWSAMSFMTMFFQYVGIDDLQAASITAASTAGMMAGGLLGGYIGDTLTRWSRFHGRPFTAQVSVACGIPLIWAVLKCVPRTQSSYETYVGLMFIFGLTASWCAVGVNRPILTEVVSANDRATVVAWLCALDGSFACIFGAPIVGLLADNVFGYRASELLVSEMPTDQRTRNAAALGQAMFFLTATPWALCLAFYSVTHWTYKADILAAEVDEDTGAERESNESDVIATETTLLMSKHTI